MSISTINDLLDTESNEYFNGDEFEDCEWIGKPNFLTNNRDFSVIKKGDKYYFDVWNQYINDECLIELDDDISQEEFIKLVKRYDNDRIAPEVGEVSILVLHRFKMKIHKHYKSPVCVEDDEDGWHKQLMAYGKVDDIVNFEKSLFSNSALCKTILRQMTAFYNDGEPLTSIEARYSSSLLEFILRPSDNILFVVFYYKGTDIDDIPIDIVKCMDDFGIYRIEE
jgi:hypothetical protein